LQSAAEPRLELDCLVGSVSRLALRQLVRSVDTPTRRAVGFDVFGLNTRAEMGPKGKFVYAVKVGRVPGIYQTWKECEAQVKGFNNPTFRKFPTVSEAEEFISGSATSINPPKSHDTYDSTPQTKKRKLPDNAGTHPHPPNSQPTKQWCGELKKISSDLKDCVGRTAERLADHGIMFEISFDFDAIQSRLASVISGMEKSDHKQASDHPSETASEPNKVSKDDGSDESSFQVVYTDGACEGNGKAGARAGIGVYWGPDHPWNVSEPVRGEKATNNAAEIQAVIRAVETGRDNAVSKLKIKTDSQFLINCVTKWMPSWKKNGWKTAKGHEVINKADLLVLDKALEYYHKGRAAGSDRQVVFEYVPAHTGVEGNEAADRLAVQGARLYKN